MEARISAQIDRSINRVETVLATVIGKLSDLEADQKIMKRDIRALNE